MTLPVHDVFFVYTSNSFFQHPVNVAKQRSVSRQCESVGYRSLLAQLVLLLLYITNYTLGWTNNRPPQFIWLSSTSMRLATSITCIHHALIVTQHHRPLQAQAHPGIARVISNHAYSYQEDQMQTHIVSSM